MVVVVQVLQSVKLLCQTASYPKRTWQLNNVSLLIGILILSVTIQMIVACVLLFTFSRNHWSVSLGLRDTDSLKDILATFGGHTTMLTAGLDF